MDADKNRIKTENIEICQEILDKLSSDETDKKEAKTLLKEALSIYSACEAVFKADMEEYSIEYSDNTGVEEILAKLKKMRKGADTKERFFLDTVMTSTEEYYEIKELFLYIKFAFEHFNNFNKTLFIRNIRTLVGRSDDVRIGDIEDEANVSRGTTSRYESIKNNTEPSVEFVASAAKKLGVSIDSLINIDFSKLPVEEDLIFKFIQKLIKYTDEGKMNWEAVMIFDVNDKAFEIDGIIELDIEKAEICYKSDYYPDVSIHGSYVYRTHMPESNNLLLYFIPCSMGNNIYYEMYFVEEDIENPATRQNICCSHDLSHYVQVYVENLRDAINDNSKKKGMSKNARNTINKFLNDM